MPNYAAYPQEESLSGFLSDFGARGRGFIDYEQQAAMELSQQQEDERKRQEARAIEAKYWQDEEARRNAPTFGIDPVIGSTDSLPDNGIQMSMGAPGERTAPRLPFMRSDAPYPERVNPATDMKNELSVNPEYTKALESIEAAKSSGGSGTLSLTEFREREKAKLETRVAAGVASTEDKARLLQMQNASKGILAGANIESRDPTNIGRSGEVVGRMNEGLQNVRLPGIAPVAAPAPTPVATPTPVAAPSTEQFSPEIEDQLKGYMKAFKVDRAKAIAKARSMGLL